MHVVLARAVVLGMVALAIFVQLGVWGATKIRADGALFESWQPYFGWQYGIAFALVQLGVCHWLAIDRGAVWLMRAWAVGAALLALVWLLTGRAGPLDVNNGVALVSGFGALVLAVGLYEGGLAPGTARRPAGRTR